MTDTPTFPPLAAGPWTIQLHELAPNTYCPYASIRDPFGRPVAQVAWSAGYHTPAEDVAIRSYALARALAIAALPDLLEACHGALNVMGTAELIARAVEADREAEEGAAAYAGTCKPSAAIADASARLVAAIAKAEGRDQ